MELLLEVAPGIDPKEVKMESRLYADLGLDSMSGMLLLMEIEDAFQVELEENVRFEQGIPPPFLRTPSPWGEGGPEGAG